MSAPASDDALSFTSSSGHVDGLGRRVLAFDRESGAVLERLYLRPELAAFEAPLRRTVETLAAFEDERFARPVSVERDPSSGELSVLAEFIAGSRLSDLLETAEDAGLVPGVDVALGFLLEALPGISGFHAANRTVHGLIDPTRLVISPAGQVIFLDATFGPYIERLGLSRARLWQEFGLASPAGAGAVSFDVAADLAQIALTAVTLVIGRRLRPHEYPDGLGALVMEVVEVAQIRGSATFATSLQRLLQRTLPLPGRRPYRSADELANEVRLLLRREIGPELCRQALIDFAEQMDRSFPTREENDAPARPDAAAAEQSVTYFGLDAGALGSLDSLELLDEREHERSSDESDEIANGDGFEEVPLDGDALAVGTPLQASEDGTISPAHTPADVVQPGVTREGALVGTASTEEGPAALDSPPRFPEVRFESEPAPVEARPAAPAPEFEPVDTLSEIPADTFAINAARRKKQQKSARARKDKLRSASTPKTDAPQPKPSEPQAEKPKASQTGWLVSPDRAAAFAPPVDPGPSTPPAQTPTVPPPAAVLSPAPPVPAVARTADPPAVAVPAPVTPVRMPSFGPPPAPAPTPPPVTPAAVVAPPPPKPPIKLATGSPPLKLKEGPPPGFRHQAPARMAPPVNPYTDRGPSFEAPEAPSRFPWKLAAAAVILVAAAAVVGRAYLPSKTATPPPASVAAPAPAPSPPSAAPAAPAAASGIVEIETQPAGARVLLDGKPVGQSPLKLASVAAGRHTVTLISPSGEVTRAIRVTQGKTTTVDVAIFSGWVAVFAPIVLEVAADGRPLGTTEQDRLMLPPGKHELTLTNRELGYTGVQQVEIEPGEVRSVTVDPRGVVNFNAVPWAEVWLEGRKLGDTPLANQRLPIGTREFVFRHPQYGERKVTVTVRGDQPASVSTDFTRLQ